MSRLKIYIYSNFEITSIVGTKNKEIILRYVQPHV